MLAHAHVNWISDQPGSLHKLAIHFGTQLAHPAVACNDSLIEWPPGRIRGYDDDSVRSDMRGDLAFRLRVAMLGSFGISAAIDRWSAADIATAKTHVALYANHLRDIIHFGDQYQLTEPPTVHGIGDWAVMWYVSKDGRRGVLFAFRLGGAAATRVFQLPGLLPAAPYRIWLPPGDASRTTGAVLAAGLAVTIEANFASCLCRVEVDRSPS